MKGLGYYEAAAQIIPIFLFAIGFLSREYGTAALEKYMSKSLRWASSLSSSSQASLSGER